jgi:2-oxoisovalerate dehydrogenase E1 component alpha subunit
MHDLMVKSRCMEERLIKMYKQNDGYFWIGGPGEEAFSVPLGLLINKGKGPKYDYFHGHYRASPTLVAMGLEPIDAMRQMKNTATDPFSRGRNFCGHMSISKWNVAPISSPIEVQYPIATGTARAQKNAKSNGITIVTGGDAGTAEGDFASCLVWASRPGDELPMLIIVTNNRWGISTPYGTQHGEQRVADRGKAFGMRTMVINGNDPETSYLELKEAIGYIRETGKPILLEADVSRLYGHSSASGANFVTGEDDPIELFEKRLAAAGLMTSAEMKAVWDRYSEEMAAQAKIARSEPMPDPESIWDHVYVNQTGRTDRFW